MAHAQKPDFVFRAKRTSPCKSAGASVQSTTGSRGVRISGSDVGYTMFRCSVKSTGYPLHSPVSPSLHLPCVTVCHYVSTGLHRIRPQKLNVTRLAKKLCVLWKTKIFAVFRRCMYWARWKQSTQLQTFWYATKFSINLLKTKRRMIYLKTQFAPRCKHFSSRL